MADTQIIHSTRLSRILSTAWLLFVIVLTLEVTARIDDWVRYGASPLRNYDFDQLFRLTDRGIRGVPNGRYMRWRLNTDGLNGPEIRPDEGQARVVIYGASESFGIYEDAGKEFPRVLESELNVQSHDSRYEVINAGIPGMRVGSGINFLRELNERLHPKVVVIYPTPTHYIGVARPFCGRQPKILTQTGSYLPDFRVAGKLKDTVKRVLPIQIITYIRTASIAWQLRGQEPMMKVAAESLKAFESDLQCAVAAVRDFGIAPILSTHANRFGDTARAGDAAWLTGWRQQYPEMHEDGFVDLERRANEAVRNVAARDNVLLVDAAVALTGRGELFADHAHFNNQGAVEMAALLVPAVVVALRNTRQE